MPIFRTKKEPFDWLRSNKKTIDVRKGNPQNGHVAVYLSGRNVLKLKIIKTETGRLTEIVRSDNYRFVIPSALVLEDAIGYLRGLYVGSNYDDVFTAYYVSPL